MIYNLVIIYVNSIYNTNDLNQYTLNNYKNYLIIIDIIYQNRIKGYE